MGDAPRASGRRGDQRARHQPAEGEQGGVILVSVSVDPHALKAPLPWELAYRNQDGGLRGGVVRLPSGAPIEIAFTESVLPAASH